jgi:UTP:GlnB (protein PII) uridylyltransferase
MTIKIFSAAYRANSSTLPCPQVTIHNDAHRQLTIIEVTAPDRPGCWHESAASSSTPTCRCKTRSPPSASGWKTFFVTDAHNQPLSDPELCTRESSHHERVRPAAVNRAESIFKTLAL